MLSGLTKKKLIHITKEPKVTYTLTTGIVADAFAGAAGDMKRR